MFIKEVVVDGFKSYAQRTVLEGFDPYFNAITGLNGSGKSNILDAICFVLGISNLTQVRVGNLQELVYKQGQAGVNKASVALVFNNKDKAGSPMGYAEYDEITVTRQVVIGGKNKYLINGKQQQQSQVANLFHSVQLNVNNPHFLIMQGRIMKVLNMKPPEILGMIEEAAGTRMFENKKQTSLKIIEKKQAKVDEIESILREEITPKLEQLRGEKKDFTKWQTNKTEEERLRRFCIAYEFSRAVGALVNSDGELKELQEEKEGLEARGKEAAAEALAADEEAKEIRSLRDGKVGDAIKVVAQRREDLSKELVQASSALDNKKSFIKAEQKALEAMMKSDTESGAAIATKEGSVREGEEAVGKAEALLKEAEGEYKRLQGEYQGMCAGVASGNKEESLTLVDQIAASAAEASAAQAQVLQGSARIKHLKATAKTTEKEMKAAENQVLKLRKQLEDAHARSRKAETDLAALGYNKGQEEGLLRQREEDEKTVEGLRETVNRLQAQLSGRLNFQYSDPERNFNRSNVKGLVANLIRVKNPAHSTALEVAAGGKLYQVVVDSEHTGKLLLQKGKLRKRVTIIPLNKISSRSLRSTQLSRASSIAARMGGSATSAIELVGYEDELVNAMGYVFGGIIVCNTLDVANQVAFDKGVRAPTVTLDGDTVEPQGTLTGGSKSQLGVVLARLGELQEHGEKLGAVEERLRQVCHKLERLSEDSAQYATLNRELEVRSAATDVLRERLSQSSHSQLASKLEETKGALSEALVAVEAATATANAAKERNNLMKKEESSFREAREKLLEDLERRVKKAKADVGAAAAELNRVKQCLGVEKMELTQLREAGSSMAEQLGAAENGLAVAAEEAAVLKAATSEKKSLYEEANGELESLKVEQAEHDSSLKELARRKDKASKVQRTAELDLKKVDHRLKSFVSERKKREGFVRVMKDQHPWIEEEQKHFGAQGTDFDFANGDPVAKQNRLKELEKEQKALGKKINKTLLSQLDKTETQYKELVHKKEVVEQDKCKIRKVIDELDEKKIQALQGTWAKVNMNFGSIFSTLLPGTSAKLQPLEGQTVMAGLEVKVKFGVWKESLTELSGGQRSLLALSLILSLLLFKPAPMYILDEVDAALDLSHTQNIGTMLKTHFSQSQFIVVSLKEGMFNNANVIYRTKFVDGASTVGRTVNRSQPPSGSDARRSPAVTAGSKSRARKRGKTAGSEENEATAAVP